MEKVKSEKVAVKEKSASSTNTIFDDVFRTMVEKMPRLLIPLINEVFGTNYGEDEEIVQKRNEHQREDGEIITDACFEIRGMIYHIECQSKHDTTMVIRMAQYDSQIAFEGAVFDDDTYTADIKLPKSCVIYLRHNKNTPEYFTLNVTLPDDRVITTRCPIFKVKNYSKEDIFEKDLLMLLPFYAMRYEEKKGIFKEGTKELAGLIAEYTDIVNRLRSRLDAESEIALCHDLIELMDRITQYVMVGNEDAQKGVGQLMRGNVLKLESETLLERGANMLASLITMLSSQNKYDDIDRVLKDESYRRELYNKYGIGC